MKQHTLSSSPIAAAAPRRWAGGHAWQFIADHFLLLPIGVAIALVWANTAAESYFTVSHALSFAVNDIAMVFFIGLVTQEIVESAIPGGALHTWRRWSMPVAAAAGGLAGAAAVYLAYIQWRHQLPLAQGWPVACAIDIAAGYYLLRAISPRSGALPFLLMLAVVTDLVGLVVIALWPSYARPSAGGGLLMLAAVGLAALMRYAKMRAFWPYLVICGSLSWYALYREGIHPALALVPIVPFLPHEPRQLDVVVAPHDDDDVHHFEHEWNDVVQVVLLFFGLVNGGVILRGETAALWAILLAALVGRPLGIMAAVGIAHVCGLQLPRRVGWRELVVIALATSSGFTFALLFAASLIPTGAVLSEITIGALATVGGAGIALVAARGLGVGRFRRVARS